MEIRASGIGIAASARAKQALKDDLQAAVPVPNNTYQSVDDDEQSRTFENQKIIQSQHHSITSVMYKEKLKLWKGISTDGKFTEKHGSARKFPSLRASTSLRLCVSV